MRKIMLLLPLAALLFALTSCNSKDQATLNIRLTDAPADYDAVLIDIQKVLVNGGDDENSGWIEMQTTPGIYNLLDYTAGKSTQLATAPLGIGKLKQIRLVLGDRNSVVVDGIEYKLETPSAQQSGLKLKVNQTLSEGVEYTAILDFDASKSVVSAGQKNKYNLKPTIRMYFEANSGSIKGSIEPAGERVLVEVPVSDTVILSTYSDVASGIFLVPGVPEGTRNVIISTATGSMYKGVTISNVAVVTGKTTLLDKVVLKTN